MKNIKFKVLALVLCLSLFVLSGCTSDTDRVQEALNKLESADAISVKGNMTGSIDAGKLGTTGIELHCDIKITDMGSCISMQISTDASSISMEEDIYMQQYIVGDRVYIYCPQLTSQYIDCSSEYQQITDEGIGTIMAALDFDAGSTQLEYGDTTINYQGNETNVLMVMVQLDDEQLSDLIQNLLVRQNVSYNALSGEDRDEIADEYKTMEVESAEYALFIDDDNNIIRYYVRAVLSLDILGQDSEYDIQMQYDVLATGDSVTVDVPDIQPDNVVQYETLLA
jgi:hypothetical protein